MQIQTTLKKVIRETQANVQTTLKDDSQDRRWDFYPEPPPWEPPRTCTTFYQWVSVGVIITATIIVLMILIYFCGRRKGNHGGLEQIITNIELQNFTEGSNRTQGTLIPQRHFKVARGENVKITVVERY